MGFKYEGNQQVYIASTKQRVTVIARTEFFTGKQARYCVRVDEGSIVGKNTNEDWINEDQLIDELPVEEEETDESEPTNKAAHITHGKKTHDIKIRKIKTVR